MNYTIYKILQYLRMIICIIYTCKINYFLIPLYKIYCHSSKIIKKFTYQINIMHLILLYIYYAFMVVYDWIKEIILHNKAN